MNIFKFIIIFIAFNLIYGCVKTPYIKFNKFDQKNYSVEFDNGNINTLSIICSDIECRMVVFDMLGTPIVNKLLKNNKLKNNKFLPPNNDYNDLFIYLINLNNKDNKTNNSKYFSYKIKNKDVKIYLNK